MPRKKTRRRRLRGGNRWTRATRTLFSKKPEYAVALGALGTAGLGTAINTYKNRLPSPAIHNVPQTTGQIYYGMNEHTYNNQYNKLMNDIVAGLINSQESINHVVKNYHFDPRTKELTVNGKVPDIFQLLLLTLSQPKEFFYHFMNYDVTIDNLKENRLLIELCKETISYLESLEDNSFTGAIKRLIFRIVPSTFVSWFVSIGIPLPINERIVQKWIEEIKEQDFSLLRKRIIELAKQYLDKYDQPIQSKLNKGAPYLM